HIQATFNGLSRANVPGPGCTGKVRFTAAPFLGSLQARKQTSWRHPARTAQDTGGIKKMSSDNSHDEFLTGARKLLRKRPIMAGEDPADYGLLMKLVSRDVRPQDLREWLLVKDIVDSEWEVLRLRGLKVTMLHAMVPRAVRAQMFRHGASFPELVQPLRT